MRLLGGRDDQDDLGDQTLPEGILPAEMGGLFAGQHERL